jgi:hypothetical protein
MKNALKIAYFRNFKLNKVFIILLFTNNNTSQNLVFKN